MVVDRNVKRANRTAVRVWSRYRADAVTALLVAAVIIVGAYSEVAFGGRTFSTAQASRGVDACAYSDPHCPIAQNDPRVDLFPQAWQLAPWAHVTSASLRAHRAPLWNPYEAGGAPLAANMSSAALDPLLLPVNLHPSLLTWDVIFLLTFALNGIATFVLARVLGLRRPAATAAALTYALSGFFFRDGNNAFIRVHLYMPLLLLVIEWLFRRRGSLPVLTLALGIAGCMLVGMPEPAFIICFSSGIYAVARLFAGPRTDTRVVEVTRLGGGAVLGLMLAAPLLLPFAEYLAHAKTFKSGAGSHADPTVNLVNWIAPKVQAGGTWTGTWTWIGAGAAVAAVVALASPGRMRRNCGWPLAAVSAILILKFYGAPVASLIGHLPGAAQVLWPRWGTPELTLPLALLAGIGVEAVANRDVNLRILAILLGTAAIVVAAVVTRDHDKLLLGTQSLKAGGLGIAAVVAVLVAGLAIWRRPRAASLGIVAVIVIELLVLTPRGFYSPRRNPFPNEGWIRSVSALARSPGYSRIFSTDGLLFPNTAGVYQLADPRVVDAIYVERYFRYFHTYVSGGTFDRWIATGPTETFPAIFDNPMFDLMGARYVVQKHPFTTTDSNYHIVKRTPGRVIYENTAALPRAFVVRDVRTVPNESATVAYLNRHASKNTDGSLHPVLDPRTQAVIEAPGTPSGAARRSSCVNRPYDIATITHYDPSRIEVRVNAPCGGLLVVSDTYFPGWEAGVNGRTATIYPTDLAFRGIRVPPGRSSVTLRYRPSSFRAGLLVALLGVLGFAGVAVGSRCVARRRRSRR